MKVLFINVTCGTGSHGRICAAIARKMEQEGNTCRIGYGRFAKPSEDSKDLAVRIGNRFTVLCHVLYTRIFDAHGFGSYYATKRFLKGVDTFKPDMLWLHNIHGYYIHVGLLFKWIKQHPEIKVNWTLHDCWAFTGHCSHYMAAGCSKWKTQCSHCPEKRQYPESLFLDNSKKNYIKKKELFTGIQNLTLFTPSQWLADQTRESFLKEYPVKVVHNEIDHLIFRKETDSTVLAEIRTKYRIPADRQILLGVASKWTERKGLKDYIRLAASLRSDRQCLVMVGVDEKLKQELPKEIIGIERTENRQELSGLYSLADLFLNLTYEDTYPTVNLEAEACGTDVFTYDAGGSPETIKRDGSEIFKVGDLESVLNEINLRMEEKK